jgi:hypothetical protein
LEAKGATIKKAHYPVNKQCRPSDEETLQYYQTLSFIQQESFPRNDVFLTCEGGGAPLLIVAKTALLLTDRFQGAP